MSERYINNLSGDFSICFSEHLTEHPTYLINNADDIIKWIGTQIPIIWNAILIR